MENTTMGHKPNLRIQTMSRTLFANLEEGCVAGATVYICGLFMYTSMAWL